MYFKIALDILGLLHINFSIGLWIFIKKNLWDFDWDYIKATDQFGEDPKFYSFLFKLMLLSLGKGGKMRASLWYHLGNLFKIYVSYPPLLIFWIIRYRMELGHVYCETAPLEIMFCCHHHCSPLRCLRTTAIDYILLG